MRRASCGGQLSTGGAFTQAASRWAAPQRSLGPDPRQRRIEIVGEDVVERRWRKPTAPSSRFSNESSSGCAVIPASRRLPVERRPRKQNDRAALHAPSRRTRRAARQREEVHLPRQAPARSSGCRRTRHPHAFIAIGRGRRARRLAPARSVPRAAVARQENDPMAPAHPARLQHAS